MTKHQQSLNHPQKGSRITVDPIRSLEDINEIKLLLRNDPLYLCLSAPEKFPASADGLYQ